MPETLLFETTGAIIGGRLTLASGLPVTTDDVTAASTVYYTPFKHNMILMLDSAGNPQLHTFSEVSISLSGLTSGRVYDVFGSFSTPGSNLTLTLSTVFDSTDVRADALSVVNGIPVLASDYTKRWLGSIKTTSTTATEDSLQNRLVYNGWNRVRRKARAGYRGASPTSWTKSVASWTNINSDASAAKGSVLWQHAPGLGNLGYPGSAHIRLFGGAWLSGTAGASATQYGHIRVAYTLPSGSAAATSDCRAGRPASSQTLDQSLLYVGDERLSSANANPKTHSLALQEYSEGASPATWTLKGQDICPAGWLAIVEM